MSYTILTIPFNLKEKQGGAYLKKGFVIDDVLPEFFECKNGTNSFLHVATFKNAFLKKTLINLFIKENFPDFEFLTSVNDEIFASTSFFDTGKYLHSSQDYVQSVDFEKLNVNNRTADKSNLLKIPHDTLTIDCFYQKDTTSHSKANFDIAEIKLFVNRLASSMDSIGFGYIEIVLQWKFDNAGTMIENLAPLSELFRFYGEDTNNKFDVFGLNNSSWNAQLEEIIENISLRNENPKIPEERKTANTLIIEKFRKIKKDNNFKKLDFKLLVDTLLKNISKDKNVAEVFYFNQGSTLSKPYVLHLANLQGEEKESIDLDSAEVSSKVHRLLRIAGSGNTEINKLAALPTVSPDIHTKQFILNEGAFIIEGSKTVSELLNKYYPAYLFALNQKYLFNYMQEKINELPVEPTTGKYKTEDLKQLQETLIYAEFSQIFTSLSNYHEIDQFFEKLREQFKIKQLKEEYFDSVNGISKITHLKEKEESELILRKEEDARRIEKEAAEAMRLKEEQERRIEKEMAEDRRLKEEQERRIEKDKAEDKRIFEREKDGRISELRAQKLNLVLLLLTIAQVWSGLFESLHLSELKFSLILNIVVYVLLIIIGLIFYFIIDKKEKIEKNGVFVEKHLPVNSGKIKSEKKNEVSKNLVTTDIKIEIPEETKILNEGNKN
jgi:hypothetical protein